MNLLSIENLTKSYGEKVLFKNLSLGINEGEKIGLIGINGTGKSSLLKIIAGDDDDYDEGKIIKNNDVRIEYLSQNTNFHEDSTVLDAIFKGNSSVMRVVRDYENIVSSLEQNPTDESLQKKLVTLNNKMDAENAWEIENKAKTILTKLGITNFDDKVGTLSGGQKKRIALAAALINPCELLILDEPTNHIDNETVKWLEDYLNDRKGALVMITHDRYFLDRVTNRILELHNGNLYSYEGNYSMFVESKAERQQLMESLESKRQNLLRRELAWIKRGAKARSTKQKARIDRFEDLKSKVIDVDKEKMEISIQGSRLGKKVIGIEGLNKTYEDRNLINDFSYIFTPGDRVGIIGKNGMGKSTLLNIIIDKIKADSGNIDIGETVKIGYFSQEYEGMDDNMRVIEYIREAAEFIKDAEGNSISATKMLERFLFPSELQYTYISKLSGGEKRRLYLLRVLMYAPNVLILDEPTNDLDIEALNILEEFIEFFNGTVITVSHDRYFLDKVCRKILSFEGNGKIIENIGNYSDYEEKHKKIAKEIEIKDKKDKKDKTQKDTKQNKTLKFSYNEKREYEQIDGIIESKECELEEINEEISNAGCDYLILQELLDKRQIIENDLDKLMERWAYLNELSEKINNQN
ncbi:ABC-F family ATP-binding cassette domain-containing protein [Clostridium botulinum]|uniref:ABC transporter n=2 Tax=Clostridium botulinum TaxID=1491 RepID=A0A9Q1V0L0_CLOBO|nr:ABC-F family ATP-binding cassette domain-containing protein [Clostridium botulinum]AEB76233.1 ABC transporter, ATP-binding protein [Clostridium botulinum BKT015925]KEI04969.1 ABC transporter [Clostridium botulinum C/D str. Sp77]KLU75853.1 ABC transporter [Clostridium botulinum V891]KOA76081.1 ABC transporter [Clostridium botulinum]KOA77496.1 ABC transporter [Clostridium botulinum]